MLFNNVGSQLVNILYATLSVICKQLPWKDGLFKKLVETTCVLWVKREIDDLSDSEAT